MSNAIKNFDFVKNMTHRVYQPLIYDYEGSVGNYLRDSLTGKFYLDCCSFFATNPLGFNHPSIKNDESFLAELLETAKINPANGDFYTPQLFRFLKEFSSLVPGFPHVFLISGGTLAVENALKIAFDWKFKKLLQKGIVVHPNDLGVLYFDGAFHGRSGYALTLSNTSAVKTKFFPQFDWPRFRFPNTEAELYRIDQYLASNSNYIASIIIEPVLGAGGDLWACPGALEHLRDVADRHNIILIYDEIQTAFMTGKTWCYENYNLPPDIIVFGKKFQVCGIAASDRIMEIEPNCFTEDLRIDSTWGGNITDMVRGRKYLEVIKSENLLDNVTAVGKYLLSNLKELAEKYNSISSPRGLGLMCAFDVYSTGMRNKLVEEAFNQQLLLLPGGSHTIRLRPSLTFTSDNVDSLILKLDQSLKNLING